MTAPRNDGAAAPPATPGATQPAVPVLQVRDIRKTYGGVAALKGISLDLLPGEVHCLAGENGCGKSTLIKIISGAEKPDSGEIVVDGVAHRSMNTVAAIKSGIQVIYQDFSLFPNLTVGENIVLTAAVADRRRLYSPKRARPAAEAIVNELRAQGELDNTLILFTSDNGFFQGEHRIPGGKIRHYEEGSRVPLLMRGPALGVPRGVFEKQVANIDLAPTIIDAANARGKVTRRLDGRSLLSAVRRPARFPQRDILLEDGPALPKQYQYYRAIRTPRFKLVRYRNGERELYDLRRDPQELESLHRRPRYNKLQGRLGDKLNRLQDCRGPRSCR